MMMAKNVIVARAAVTLKLPVAVTPPCVTLVRNESSAAWMHRVVEQREHVEDRDQADDVGAEDEQEQRQSSGVQVSTHLSPTLGRTIDSLMKSTTASSAFMKPDGTSRSCCR